MNEYRKSLYKERKQALTPHQHSRLNRQLQEANRNKQRKDQFQLSRQISISPTPRNKLLSNKENHQEKQGESQVDSIANTSRPAKVVCTARDPAKIKKQEAYILRFLDWKDKKKAQMEMKKNDANKRKPFLSAVSKDTGFGGNTVVALAPIANHQHTFVPKDHHMNFQPPPGLRDPDAIVKEKAKSRQSVYTVVPTPPKKTKAADESISKKMPTARKALPTNLLTKTVKNNFSNKTPARLETANGNVKPVSSGPKSKVGTTNSATKTAPRTAPNNLVKNLNKNNMNSGGAKAKMAPPTTTLKPRSLKMPPPAAVPVRRPAVPPNNIRKTEKPTIKINHSGTKPKSTAATRRMENTRQHQQRLNNKSPKQSQKNARLTQTMKAKKSTKPTTSVSTKLLGLMDGVVADMIVQTPKDFSNSNHFDEFVTSTKLKNSSQTLEDVNGVSPIEKISKRSLSNSSVKRNLLKEATTKLTQIKNQVETNEINKPPTSENPGRKFNFIRYSEVNTTVNDEDDLACQLKSNEHQKEPQDSSDKEEDRTLTVENPVQEEKTPTKQPISSEDKPVNYLSPYVSVSRGKVSLKKEKEKRNSTYLVNPTEDEQLTKAVSPHNSPALVTPTSSQFTAEVRRTLEAVRYFRKQLQDEIERLHQQCDVWEEYKDANLEKLQSANCDDMIDVTIGQTRLLTSKKFMQFKGLIDRCEARATGVGDVPNDGSEKTKDVDAVDLEGFWSMLGLQVDNLQKRFENLDRWKSNDWKDPDEVKPKPKPKNLSKVKKAAPAAKAKPNSALQQMLRKMQAEMRNKKTNNLLATTDDVILTPSKVRDRKYFSPAATVVAVPASNRRLSNLILQSTNDSPNRRMSLLVHRSSQDSPNRRNTLLLRKNSQDSPNRRISLLARKTGQESPNLLKSVLQFRENALDSTEFRQASLRHSESPKRSNSTRPQQWDVTKIQTESEAYSSPAIKARKSILKTPGTAKSKLKNVVFNEKLRVKKFNFMLNDADAEVTEDCKQSNEENLALTQPDTEEEEVDKLSHGTYSLRNRKVRLRPSSEIVIPK